MTDQLLERLLPAPAAPRDDDVVDLDDVDNPARRSVELGRPWGHFRRFVQNETVTVKVITVQPGHRLSLQRHEHRGEMWQVLDRPMLVEIDGRIWLAEVDEIVWVPAGSEHRMTNQHGQPSRMLEIAFGDFDEDDIVRIQDDYAHQRVSETPSPDA
jgi:mannose-6-phosphate isomerase